MVKIKRICFFTNGNTAVFDENGQQIPELQKSWLLCYMYHFIKFSKDIENLGGIEIILPNGKFAKIDDDCKNWRIIE